MKTYETFARNLGRLLGGKQAVHITVSGYMPLSVEAIGRSAEGGTLVALSHTAVQLPDDLLCRVASSAHEPAPRLDPKQDPKIHPGSISGGQVIPVTSHVRGNSSVGSAT